ncbi:MAG: hypothetical protein OXU20_42540 [Myxococcales bacterium]|nr:hypothetical protein [Myxococcales bacterium]
MKTRLAWLVLCSAGFGCSSSEAGQPVTGGTQLPTGEQHQMVAAMGNGSPAMMPPAATTPPNGAAGMPDMSMAGPVGAAGTATPMVMPMGTPASGNPAGPVAGAPAGTDPTSGNPAAQPGQETAPSPEGECATAGIELEGLMYSPGGTALPFPCKPFHPTTNNPYAVRCVDAWPWYETGFPGDEFCILPPEPGKGIQIGVHPQGTDWYTQMTQQNLGGYENPEAGFLLASGGEEERNYKTSSPNPQPINFYRSYVRMRAGSHHMIVSAANAAPNDGRGTWTFGDAVAGLFGGTGLPGAQRPDANVPQTLERPPEDKGLFRVLGPDQTVTYNMHHFNATDVTILKEAWANLWFTDETSIPIEGIFGMPLTQAIQTFAQPGQTVDIHHSWTLTNEVRIVQLFGHRHAWTTNFSAWTVKSDGSTEVLYQSFDWYDQPTYRYDSVTENPAVAPEMLSDGAASGVRVLKPGDQLHFNCHMEFTPERAAKVEGPSPSSIGPLRFANQAFQGEMCILFGNTSMYDLPSPIVDISPVPDFATID